MFLLFCKNGKDLLQGIKTLMVEKEMAAHSSIAWRIPWTEEPGGLQSMVSQSRTQLSNFTFTWRLWWSFPGGISGKNLLPMQET